MDGPLVAPSMIEQRAAHATTPYLRCSRVVTFHVCACRLKLNEEILVHCDNAGGSDMCAGSAGGCLVWLDWSCSDMDGNQNNQVTGATPAGRRGSIALQALP